MLSQSRAYGSLMRYVVLIGITVMIALAEREANADQPQVVLTTSVGTMIATLDEERAPHTVANFLELVEA
ncbi:MAG: hypothetical protein VX211_02425, partial [Pseudomonadota bacterium]|nr:hypothetical protein [Pseudomonadota bacterium]